MEPNELTVFVILYTTVKEIKGDYLKNCSVGFLNLRILGKPLRDVVHKYYCILLANELVQAISERNVCTKLEENQ